MSKYLKNASNYHKKVGKVLYEMFNTSDIEQEKNMYIENITTIDRAKKMRVDFFVKPFNLAIEVDGEQHFKPIAFSNSITYEDFEQTIFRDKLKEQICAQNSWELLRIPYWKCDTEKNIAALIMQKIKELIEKGVTYNASFGNRSRNRKTGVCNNKHNTRNKNTRSVRNDRNALKNNH
ncbi:MAG: hypothetical protein BWY04_01478 [candidate division CPR1 bacterium ADurb.Bin160]|uniref:DUF559 domain-containing protein n=1 Tax=candidate division CPR1 bacterium ADurb.Bin160 TaxID=1852826 RepID=A0A1V5ZIA7_9BACT|nr:MAG: hypothetical protein BWY04_01478 [candidate division CPR1 bacterium ADurb.Bin160]